MMMLMTAILCAESKSRRELSTMRSNLETLAAAARRWAARNRATRWSGVSTKGGGVPPPPEGGPEEEGFGEDDDDGAGGASRLEVLELACGVAAVNRVASETLRGAGGAGIGGDVVWLLKRGWLWSLRGGGCWVSLGAQAVCVGCLSGGVDLGGAQIIRYPHAQGFLPQPSEIPYATLWRFVSVVNAGGRQGGWIEPDRQNFGVRLRLGTAIVGCFNCHHDTPRAPVHDIEMRGLQRLRGPASCLSTCTATAPRTTPFLRQLSTSTPLQHRSRPTTPRATTHLRQRNASTATTTTPTEAEIPEFEFADDEPAPIDTDLVLPGERTEADLPDQITDAEYVPAVSAEGLEEVGGLDGWWDRPGTWGESKRYQGFGPREKVMDKSMLEVLTRQALIEAVILHQHKRPSKVTLPGPEARREVLLAEITAGPEGEATIAPEVRKMVLALGRSKVEGSAVAGETPAAEDQVAEEAKITGEGLESEDVEDIAGEPAVVSHELNPVEARRLMKQWDSSWKKLTLENPVLKFWVGCPLRTAQGPCSPL